MVFVMKLVFCFHHQQTDNALHILSGCRHNIISVTVSERHNVACRLIMKAISKGSLVGCSVPLLDGSTDRLAQWNHQNPEHAYNRTSHSWLPMPVSLSETG